MDADCPVLKGLDLRAAPRPIANGRLELEPIKLPSLQPAEKVTWST
jgi:hypothetical protein